MKTDDIRELERIAARCRQNVLRMVRANGSGHLGPAYSCIDIVTALYFHAMNIDPQNPKKEDRDISFCRQGTRVWPSMLYWPRQDF